MADSGYLIDQTRLDAGARILQLTDMVGFDAYAAAWIHDRPTGAWKYLLSTPMLKTQGPLWVYHRLMTLFRYNPLPEGVSPLDMYVIDPEHETDLFGNAAMGSTIRSKNDPKIVVKVIVITHDFYMKNISVTDGFVSFYRKISTSERQKKKNPSRTFDRKISLLKAA